MAKFDSWGVFFEYFVQNGLPFILFNQAAKIKLSTSSKNLEGPNCIHDQNVGRLWSGYILVTKFGELSKSAQNAILVGLSWELVQNDAIRSAN